MSLPPYVTAAPYLLKSVVRPPKAEFREAPVPAPAQVAKDKQALIERLQKQGVPPHIARQLPIRLVTYNTAVGNGHIKTRQQDFLKLGFYRDVLQGAPDAPILALQEVGDEQVKAVRRAAEQSGNFSIVRIQRTPAVRGQSNMLLVPKRFDVVSAESRPFLARETHGSDLSGKLRDGLGRLTGRIQSRYWSKAQLRDRFTGQTFTVFNTHLTSFEPAVREAQARELRALVAEASKHGEVIVMGDLNARPQGGTHPKSDARVRTILSMTDLGPQSPPNGFVDLDWILGDGFTPVAAARHDGRFHELPGAPPANQVSDHAAEDVLAVFTRPRP